MPKLLDYLKEKGLSHEDVIRLINEKDDLPETQEEEKDVPEEEIQEDDKPEEKAELYITNMVDEEPEAEEETVEEEITLTQEELDKKIADAVEEKLKAKRKVPSKGKIVGKPQADVQTIKRNWFEEIV